MKAVCQLVVGNRRELVMNVMCNGFVSVQHDSYDSWSCLKALPKFLPPICIKNDLKAD